MKNDSSKFQLLKLSIKEFGYMLFSYVQYLGGIFFYSDEQQVKIWSCKFSGKRDVQKFSGMTAYIFELAYDLALSPSKNVSDSPGFEACGLDLD